MAMSLWGGRFNGSPSESVFALSRSIDFDWRLAPYDLIASLAHLDGLENAQIINKEKSQEIRSALQNLLLEVRSGKFIANPDDEDVHSALERGLKEKLGDLGGALRAGRSRNDQIATDVKIYLLEHMNYIEAMILELADAFSELAMGYLDLAAPGFTHLQHAQPITFAQELSKHSFALERDLNRIADWRRRTSVLPLGAGALAGSRLVPDPERNIDRLGFTSLAGNSIDAVADRDFIAEALFIFALIGVHLSRIGEEFTLYASSEFSWAVIDDAYATGSSIMPQKKNPDVAELARGKSGRFIGNLTSLLVTLKGLPFAYNRDLQEDKEPLFDSLDQLFLLLPPVIGMVKTVKFNRDKISKSASQGFALATEIADFLVERSIPFAQAHEIAGESVRYCEVKGIELDQLSAEDLVKIDPRLTPELLPYLQVDGAIASRSATLATSSKSVEEEIQKIRNRFKKIAEEIKKNQDLMSKVLFL
jgi:argininosuccinate lyase